MSENAVTVHVDQAMFGEVRSGHALLATTTNRSFGQALALRLDLPDQPPPGISWKGFINGFSYENRYVLARTEPDRRASRTGMVFSHAFIVPLERMIELTDLRPFFARLASQRPASVSLAPLDITMSDSPLERSPALVPAANTFGVRGSLPVVYRGFEGFETFVASLWANLWPEIRREFAFRLSFTPQDLVESPQPALICTPDNLAHRWASHRILDTTDQTLLTGLATAALAGGPAGKSLLQFGRELGFQPVTFPELLELEQAQLLVAADDDAFESRLATVRVIARLSPGTNQGMGIKTQTRTALETAVEGMSSDEFLMLRNLDLASFPEFQRLWKAVARWLGAHRFPPKDDSTLREALWDATRIPNAVDAWRSAVWVGVDDAARRDKPPLAAAFWRWVSDDVTLINTLMDRLDTHSSLDAALADATPRKLKEVAAHKFLNRMACTQWRHSHAAAAAAAFGPREAVRRQLTFDFDAADAAPLRRAMRKTRPDQLIALAVEFTDSRLVELAAEEAAKKPALLVRVDVTTEIGQQIWAGALDINENAWSGPAEPQEVLYRLLESILAGRRVIPRLLLALSRTPLANLSNFPKRRIIWEHLGGDAQSGFLAATADGWLTCFVQGTSGCIPEPALERRILEPARLEPFLKRCLDQNIAHGAQLFSVIPNGLEDRFIVWLGQVLDSYKELYAGAVEHLGRVVVARNWSKALDILVQQFRNNRRDLLPALRICSPMLSVWDRWWLGITSLTKADKWDLFDEIAVELYPSGPDQDELWERAGGRNGDLEKQGTGSIRWKAVLRQMARGQNPRPAKLLSVMLRDYPSNDRLRFLANDHEFCEWLF